MSRIDQEIRNCDPGGRPEAEGFRSGMNTAAGILNAIADKLGDACIHMDALRSIAEILVEEGGEIAKAEWPEYEIAEPERPRRILMY